MVDASVLLVLLTMTALSSFMVSLGQDRRQHLRRPVRLAARQRAHVDDVRIFLRQYLPGGRLLWFRRLRGDRLHLRVLHKFAKDRKYVLQTVGGAVSVLAAITLYAVIAATGATGQDYTSISHVLGYLSIVAAIILYGAPFEKAWFVLRTKNAAPIQLPMVICGATNNALWVIYTPLDGNWFMFIPNAICVVLGISLLTLYVVYRPGKAVQPAVGLPDEDNAITIVVAPKADKIASASPSVQPMPSPLLPLSRENSFQLSSPSMSRGSSFQQLSSPALSTREAVVPSTATSRQESCTLFAPRDSKTA
ncbi:SWEET sugar transporter [Phytophthora cactorum]|nr:SWEET sugar transporter [Phytophthora cactorum]